MGIKPAIVLNPHTPPESIEFLLQDLDMVLLMSVNPGFGGQSFIESVIPKAARLNEMRNRLNPNCLIEVDGGVSNKNVMLLKEVGVDIVVAGSYVFNHPNKQEAIKSLQV